MTVPQVHTSPPRVNTTPMLSLPAAKATMSLGRSSFLNFIGLISGAGLPVRSSEPSSAQNEPSFF